MKIFCITIKQGSFFLGMFKLVPKYVRNSLPSYSHPDNEINNTCFSVQLAPSSTQLRNVQTIQNFHLFFNNWYLFHSIWLESMLDMIWIFLTLLRFLFGLTFYNWSLKMFYVCLRSMFILMLLGGLFCFCWVHPV